MMNQYMCRSFLAEQIVSDMTISRVKRRMGHVTVGIGENELDPSKIQLTARNKLIYDEGSTAYKDWLSKSTTLEDIYRHYDMPQNKLDVDIDESDKESFDEDIVTQQDESSSDYKSTTHEPLKHRGHNREEVYIADEAGGSYSGGSSYNSGGYNSGGGGVYQHSGGGGGYQHSGGGGSYSYGGYGGYNGGGGGYSSHPSGGGHIHYDLSPEIHEHVYHQHQQIGPPKYHVHEPKYGGKEKDLADLFEIALTALAFLSFAMFLVHVVMCITSVNNNATTTMTPMMPMSMGSTAPAGGMTSTGNGGGGTTNTGGGTTSTGNGGSTPTGNGGNGSGTTATGGGTTATGNGGTTATGGGTTATGGAGGTGTGGGAGTGDGAGTGGGATGTDGTTGGNPPDTGTGGGATATAGGTATATGDTSTGGDSFKFRLKREIPTITNPHTVQLNELAKRILISIESALVAYSDEGECLRKSICESSQWSRKLQGRSRLIIPFWSVGMSWLSGRLVQSVSPSTAMIDALKASVLGLGNANCEIIYQDCDLRQEVAKRRRRRRRRKRATR